MEESLEGRIEQISINDFRINHVAIKEAIEFKKKNDPAFAHISMTAIAKSIGLGESTFKKLLSGVTFDPQCSTAWVLCRAFGLDPAVIFGLAPKRDYSREEREYNPTLMDNMRRQNIALEERARAYEDRVSEQEEEIISLRRKYVSKCEECAAANERAHNAEALVRDRDASIVKHDEVRSTNRQVIDELSKRNKRVKTAAMVFTVISIVSTSLLVYLLWEIANPTIGNIRF